MGRAAIADHLALVLSESPDTQIHDDRRHRARRRGPRRRQRGSRIIHTMTFDDHRPPSPAARASEQDVAAVDAHPEAAGRG
jgi:hypothetical protein